MNLIVSKFGGTSVGSAEGIKNLKEIVLKKQERKIIVVSAISGATNLLLQIGIQAKERGDWKTILEKFKNNHYKIINDLKIKLDLSSYFNTLESFLFGIQSIKELTPRSRDYILSFGERLSSKIIENYLQNYISVNRINAKKIIKTDSSFGAAKLDIKKTQEAIDEKLIPELKNFDKIIVTGFIGSNKNNEYTTFSRGGSDYTAAILANALNAVELEIWTDVDGILTANPLIIPQAKLIKNINYKEADELAYFGAKVLYSKTIKPVIQKKIPLRVCNTFNQENKGTLITEISEKNIKSVSSKENSCIINIFSSKMLEEYGFLAKIFSIFLKYQVVVDVVSTSAVNVSVTIDSKPSQDFIKELKKYACVDVFYQKTIICIVGEGINQNNDTLARLFTSIKKYPVKMISQGSSTCNITLVVDKKNSEKVIQLIYKEFFNN
ncbi:MAG: aspartate kinase [Candidatus Kuenenbacteria bacterium]